MSQVGPDSPISIGTTSVKDLNSIEVHKALLIGVYFNLSVSVGLTGSTKTRAL